MTNSNRPPDFADAWQQSWQEWMDAWQGLAQPTPAGEKPPTPAEAWKRSTDRWLAAWSNFLEESMSRPEFSQVAGQTLSRVLDVQKPVREATTANMQRWLEVINMPSRDDIVRLARQLNDVNARLDELGDRLDEIQVSLGNGKRIE